MTALSVYLVYRFFNPSSPAVEENMPLVTVQSAEFQRDNMPVEQPKPIAISTQWRIAGKIEKGGEAWVVLSGAQGQVRLEALSQFTFDGL
ncbi:hypothetical protein [Providencia heimbachae]|uniref:hypothetical protein n=1 Tax=Providencia heimbachae TaxID=333962 RepID=UPI0020C77C9F